MKNKRLRFALNQTTQHIIKNKRRQEPLLSSLEVKTFLLSIGFKPCCILLINRYQQNVWLARGVYKRKQAIFTTDFFAINIRQHKKSPSWIVACPMTKVIIRRQPYQINEVGADIFLEKIT